MQLWHKCNMIKWRKICRVQVFGYIKRKAHFCNLIKKNKKKMHYPRRHTLVTRQAQYPPGFEHYQAPDYLNSANIR